MLNMVLEIFAIDEDIIKVNNHALANERSQNVIHKTHEGGRSIGKTKRHDEPFIETKLGLECRLPFITNCHANLVVATTQINLRENRGTTQFIKHVI